MRCTRCNLKALLFTRLTLSPSDLNLQYETQAVCSWLMDLYLILGNYLFDNLHHRAKSTTSQIPPENNCFSPSNWANWSHTKNVDVISANKPLPCLKLEWGLGWSIDASHSPASCWHRDVRISTHNPEPRLTGTACSTTALWLHSTVPVPVAAAAAQLPFPRRLCEEGGWQCPWFSKEWDLLMPSFPCIPMNQSFLPYCTLQTNFCTTFTRSYFSILIIFDFFFPRECSFVLCTCRAVGSEIRLELARIQCLAQRHLSRLGDRYCGPGAQLRCPATPSTDSWYEFQSVCVAWNIFILRFCSWIFLRGST